MKTRTFLCVLFALIALSCGGESSSSSSGTSSTSGASTSSGSGGALECTPAAQGYKDATPLMLTLVDSIGLGVNQPCDGLSELVKSKQELADAFQGMSVPAELNSVDFATARVVFHKSNPRVAWAIDDGASVVIGLETLCQGIAPYCTATIVAGTTRNALTEKSCAHGECGPVP